MKKEQSIEFLILCALWSKKYSSIYWQHVLIGWSWIWHFWCRWSSVLLYYVCYHCSYDSNAHQYIRLS